MSKIFIVSGPVIIEDNKVLLDISGDDNFWKFCGGKTKETESLQETAARRAREELGIEIEILDENPFLLHTTKETPEGNSNVILVHYLAKRIGEITSGEDIREWKWISIDELENENLAPNIMPTLDYFGFIK
ncbi:MAG: NUDIX hydrolase [Candidatus Moranbacteria bacterium]|jgi:8-oxo-dGTP pyrophosphatase MutT (NUDIX family)|nr:NUDIX hydrolase [Candidatus Moranbacteria bacterium]